MNKSAGYATPAAFRRALTDRLKVLASGSRWPLHSSSVRSPTTGCWSACTWPTTSGSSKGRPHGYRAYPLVNHIADKLAAIFERHGTLRAPSARYKDLVNLVAILTKFSVQADAQQQALESEAERRGLILPSQFDVPDHQMWDTGYRAEARRSLLTMARTLDEAAGIVQPFADPLLQRTAAGHWEPATGRWSG